MRFTQTGEFLEDNFKFPKEIRDTLCMDLSEKYCINRTLLFLNDCEEIINFWLPLSIDRPKTLGSDYRKRLRDLAKNAKALHDNLVRMPEDCANFMNAESLAMDRQLEDIAGGLEDDLVFIRALSVRCLSKLQLNPAKETGHIKHLVDLILKAYQDRFKRFPSVSKSLTDPLFIFLNIDVATAINEPIGFETFEKGVGILKKT